MDRDSGKELLNTIPNWTRNVTQGQRRSSLYNNKKNKYLTTLKVDKKVLRIMWDIMSTVTDFNLDINARKTILKYMERINPIDWLPETVAPNITIAPDIDEKILAYVMYRWVKGDFVTKGEVMNCVMRNGNALYIAFNESNRDSLYYRMQDTVKLMRNGLQDWFNTPLDELNAHHMEANLKNRKFTQLKMMERERIKEVIDRMASEIMVDEIYIRTSLFTKTMRDKYDSPARVVDDLMREVESMSIEFSGIETNTAIDMMIDFSNEKIDEVLKEAEAKLKSATPYKTGLQGVDNMTQGGLRAGELVTVGALSHNYKSGLTTTLTCGLAIANDWKASQKSTESQPALVYISMEDSLENFYRNAFEILYASGYVRNMEVCTKALEVDSGQSIKEKMLLLPFKAVVTDVTKALESRGLKLITIKADPTQWSMQGLIGLADSLILDDVNIKILVTDYFDKLPDSNMGDNGIAGEAKRMKVRIARNWGLKRGIAWINPWQLNSDVARYLTGGTDMNEFMRYMSNSPAFMGNRTLSTDFDLELFTKTFIDNEIEEGMKFLGISRGKHRGFGDVDDKDKVIFYRFKDGLKPGLDALGGTNKSHTHTPAEFKNLNTNINNSETIDF